jgi:hypothetical protein
MPRAALLVGINDYWFPHWRRLQFAESDCTRLAAALSQPQYGFTPADIRVLTAANQNTRQQPFRNNLLFDGLFASFENQRLDLFVFYFAGHGVECDGRSYLVPADGIADRIPETCISFAALLERISRLPAERRLLLLDCCRHGPEQPPAAGLPPSFEQEAKGVRGAILFSACDVHENAHEPREIQGGLFTYFWCRALQGALRDRLTVFDVQTYAQEEVGRWARERHYRQSPRIFCANCPVIFLTPRDEREAVPSFLSDSLSRTAHIVDVLHSLVNRPEPLPSHYCIRIHARLSSFAIADHEPVAGEHPGGADPAEPQVQDRRVHGLLLKERDGLRRAFDRGATFKVILSWNLGAYVGHRDFFARAGFSLEKAEARLRQLCDFCRAVLLRADLGSRLTVIRLPVTDRNLLFLGNDYLFEGRKLRVGGGFGATQVTTDLDRIEREIALFDELFADGLHYLFPSGAPPDPSERNAALLRMLVQDLEGDLAQLAELRRRGGQGGER